jgi:hypothetical protein
MSARDMIDLQIANFRGVAESIDVPVLGKAPVEVIAADDDILCLLELDTESTIGTVKDKSDHVAITRRGYIQVDAAPTSTAWTGLLFWVREHAGEHVFGNLCLKSKLVTGGAASAHLACAGLETEDVLLYVGHLSTAASISTLDDVTHLCSAHAADVLTCSIDTSNDQLWVFYHDSNGAGYDSSNLRFALVDGGANDVDLACSDKDGNAIALADVVIFCGHISTKANVATMADLTSECHCTHTAGSIQMETTDVTNDLLFVIWQDV